MEKYNLIKNSWIKCRSTGNKVQDYSLRDTLAKAHLLTDLYNPIPIVNAALYRLMLAILARAFGPKSFDEWQAIYAAGKFDEMQLNTYFDSWSYRFNLFDSERPFYQAKDTRVKPKPILKMMPHLASGNNATLFDHHTEEEGMEIDPANAARFLVALQSYGLGGLSGIKEKFTAAPASRGISFFIQGETLFETLLLNMIHYTNADDSPIPCDEYDLPCWEMDDPFNEREIPYGLLDYLTWQNRRVFLFPDEKEGEIIVRQMTEAPGMRMNSEYIDGVSKRDPYQYYRKGRKRAPIVLRFQEGRALWRNSSALLQFTYELSPPPNLCWMKELVQKGVIETNKLFQISGMGMAANKAKVMFYRSEAFPLPISYLQDKSLVNELQICLDWAENISKGLFGAASSFSETLISFNSDQKDGRKADPKDKKSLGIHFGTDLFFWGNLESHFYNLITALPKNRDEAMTGWQNVLQETAWSALEHAIKLAGNSILVLKASVKARGILGARIKKTLEP